MRDATKEERAGINSYIASISHDTGVTFYDNNVTCCMPCFLCGEDATLTKVEMQYYMANKPIQPKICEQCRKAWIKIREQVDR